MPKDFLSGLSLVRLAAKLFAAPFRRVRQLLRERRLATDPTTERPSEVQQGYKNLLGRLGAVDEADSLISQARHGFAALLSQPTDFQSNPHFRMWISNSDVQRALERVRLTRLRNRPDAATDRKLLEEKYLALSHGSAEEATDIVERVLAAASDELQGHVKDVGLQELILAGSSEVLNELQRMQGGASREVSEHHTGDAENALEKILKRRSSVGCDAIGELSRLHKEISKGGLQGAGAQTHSKVLNWLVRIASSSRKVEIAEEAEKALEGLGMQKDRLAAAWLEAARGNVDVALQSIRDVPEADCRASVFAVLRIFRSVEQALQFFDQPTTPKSPDAFTPIGWRNVVSALAAAGRVDEAIALMEELPKRFIDECPPLGLLQGIIYSARLVSRDYQEVVLKEQLYSVIEHFIFDPAAERWREKANASFQGAADAAELIGDTDLQRYCRLWLRWLRLSDPQTQAREQKAIIAELNSGGLDAIDALPFAAALKLHFEPKELALSLERAELTGGLTESQMRAKVLLLRHAHAHKELVMFIEAHADRLKDADDTAAVYGQLIESYVATGDCGSAERTLERHAADMHKADVPRFRLMIQQCRGADPTSEALALFNETDEIHDLWNLVRALRARNRWSELLPHVTALFEREASEAAAELYLECLERTDASNSVILAAFERCAPLIARSQELQSRQAWALFHAGHLKEAKAANDPLLASRVSPNDVGLDINLTIRLGDGERFQAWLARDIERPSNLPIGLKLQVARLAVPRAPELALSFATSAAEQHQNDAKVLLQAYQIALALGRDDLGGAWLDRAAELSRESEGPVYQYSTRELIEDLKARSENRRKQEQLFRDGAIPLHLAAHAFGVPLSRLLVDIPRRNRQEPDARRRAAIPFRSGKRKDKNEFDVKGLFVDITSLFLLNEVALLDIVLAACGPIHISPRTMELLLEESNRVTHHQPSQVAQAKDLLKYAKRFSCTSSVAPDKLIAEVGAETASLLFAAKEGGGLFVHSGPIYKVGSLLEKVAELGAFQQTVSDLGQVVRALKDEAQVTPAEHDSAVAFLGRARSHIDGAATVAPSCPLWLDQVSVEYLRRMKMLDPLLASGRAIHVHEDALERWRELVATEPHAAEMARAILDLKAKLVVGLNEGSVKFGPMGREEDPYGVYSLVLADMFECGESASAVCIDDRALNGQSFVQDRKGRRLPLVSSLDLLQALLTQGVVSPDQYRDALHHLRRACLFCVPVEAEEILWMLQGASLTADGRIVENAYLRTLREYLALLQCSDVLRAPADLEYLGGVWINAMHAIRQIWMSTTDPVEVCEAKASWVTDNVMPAVDAAFAFSPERDALLRDAAVARLNGVLSPLVLDDAHNHAFRNWLEGHVERFLPANPGIVDEAARRLADSIVQRVAEVISDQP